MITTSNLARPSYVESPVNSNSNWQPELISSETIVIETNPEYMKAEAVNSPDFQDIAEQIARLACYPQLVDSDQIASLPAQFNEALQKEPCVLLEDYQIRILQLRKMHSQARLFPDADQLTRVIKQHLTHAEETAKTLHLKSGTPVQDSLWPLHERILQLPTLEPDLFGAAVAALYEKLPDADSTNRLTELLQDLLSKLHPPAYYLWKRQETPLNERLVYLNKVKMESLALLHRLKQAPEGYHKQHFSAPIERVFKTYRDFLNAFEKASDEKRREMCLPKAQLSGPGLGFFSLDQDVARALVSRDEEGKLRKKNVLGTHAVHCEAGIYYKPNSDKKMECIHPEMEFAIYALYQRLGKVGVAPTTLAKIDHLCFAEHGLHQQHILQASYGISGVPLQELLDIANIMPFLKTSLGQEAFKAFEWLLQEDWVCRYLTTNPHLLSKVLSSNPEECAKGIFDAFKALFDTRAPTKRCYEFAGGSSLDKERKTMANKPQDLLIGCLALFTRYPDLAVTFTNDSKLRPVSYDALITLQYSIIKVKALFPTLSPPQLYEELSQLMTRFDSADFSTHFVVTLLTNPRDHRADNLMVKLTKNEQGGIHSLALVAIDNDRAFASSEYDVRTILYLLEPMNRPFDSTVAQQLLKTTPEEFVLDWLIALEEQNQAYERWQKRGVIIEGDLQIPLKINPSLVLQICENARKLRDKLEVSPNLTHWELLKEIRSELDTVYENASKSWGDPIEAYGELNRLFRDSKIPPPPPLENEYSPSVFPANAALQFFASFELSFFPIKHQVSLMGKALRTFPASANTLSLPGDPAAPLSRGEFFLVAVSEGYSALVALLLEEEKKSCLGKEKGSCSLIAHRNEEEQTALLLACSRLNLDMIQLLIRYGADLNACDMKGRHVFALCLQHFAEAPGQVATVIRFLVDQPTVFLNTNNRYLGWTVLHYFVQVAETAPEDAEPLLTYLITRGANPDLVDNEGKSPLDYAIELGQERLVEQLIRLGAGRTLNVEAACSFFNSRPHLHDSYTLLKSHSRLLNWHLALEYLCALSSPSEATLQGARLGKVHLPRDLMKDLLDGQGDIRSQIAYGRRNVNKITFSEGHELFFKQYPEMPGIEYAIGTFFKLLIGHGTSFTDLARLTPPNGKSYPVLISQGIKGENLHNVLSDPEKAQQLERLDPLYFSELLLASLLVNFEDAKPDNFILEPLPAGNYRLTGIDNDHAFVPPLVREGGRTIQVKCILYCLDQMDYPLHPFVRERFLSLTPERLLYLWLRQLQEQNQRYCALFSEIERKELFGKSKKHEGMVIPIALKPSRQGKSGERPEPGAIVDIYQKFRRLQIALQESSQLTGMEALRLVIPELGIRYEEAFHSYKTPMERFLSLTKTQYSTAIAGRLGTLLNSRQTLKSMGIPEKAGWENASEQGIALALRELENLEKEMHATDEQIQDIRDALQKGNVDLFNQWQLDIPKEKAINGVPGVFEGIDFKGIPLDKQKTVLSAISRGNYRSLRLCGCAALDIAAFTKLLRSSPQLLSLELCDCPKVDQEFLTQLSQLNYLTKLQLSDMPHLVEIGLPHPTLRQLEIVRCQGLQRLTISHTLKSLSIEACWNLLAVEAKLYQEAFAFFGPRLSGEPPEDFVLQSLYLSACPKLQPWWDMFKGWLEQSPTHQIQLQKVPPYPKEEHLGLVIKAVLQRSEAKEMMESLESYYQREGMDQFFFLIDNYHRNSSMEIDLRNYTGELTNRWLKILIKDCPSLSFMNLTNCKQVSDAGLGILGKGCPNLSSVNLTGCNQISDMGLGTLAKSCPNLSSVNLTGCNQISNVGLGTLAKSCPNLSSVNLTGCNQISDVGLGILGKGCPNLMTLDLKGCKEITDLGLETLAKDCLNITSVNLSGCEKITDLGLQALAEGCPNLASVILNYRNKGLKKMVAILKSTHPGIEIKDQHVLDEVADKYEIMFKTLSNMLDDLPERLKNQ